MQEGGWNGGALVVVWKPSAVELTGISKGDPKVNVLKCGIESQLAISHSQARFLVVGLGCIN